MVFIDPSTYKQIKVVQTLEVIIDGNQTLHREYHMVNIPTWRFSSTMHKIWHKSTYQTLDEYTRNWVRSVFDLIIAEDE